MKLLLTTRQYGHFDRPPMTTYAAERLVTGSYTNMMFPKKELFNEIQVSWIKCTIDGDRVVNILLMYWTSLVPPARIAIPQKELTPSAPVEERHNKVDKDEGQTTAEEHPDTP